MLKKQSKQAMGFEEYVLINGIHQYLFHSGTSDENPVLLFLHGGPGSSAALFAHAFQDKCEELFTVIHWDQRGTGKTLTKNPANYPTLDVLLQDVLEIVHYSPLFHFSDLPALIKGNKANKELMTFLGRFDLHAESAEYGVPLYYIVGEQDWQTPVALTQDYVQRITAPEKKIYIIPNAGHMPMVDQPALFLSILRDIKNRQESGKGTEQE